MILPASTDSLDPRVTVFIPAFNVETYISEAVESVLAQSFSDFEILVIDDDSTDATKAQLQRLAAQDGRLRVITHSTNLGRPKTRNHGLDLARGEFIAFLDGDDFCIPTRLEQQVVYLDSNPDIDGVGSWMTWVDRDGKPAREGTRSFRLDPDEITCQMLCECPLAQGAMMVRRRAFDGYRYDDAFPVGQDYELWARMIRTRRFANVRNALTSYRQHQSQSIHKRSYEQQNLDLTIYDRQLNYLGVTCTREDLLRHERFFKFASRETVQKRTGAPLDKDYIRWARQWLAAVRSGNAKTQVYPEPTFSDMLAARWLHACRKALRNSSIFAVGREFGQSSLTYRALFRPLAIYQHRKKNQLK